MNLSNPGRRRADRMMKKGSTGKSNSSQKVQSEKLGQVENHAEAYVPKVPLTLKQKYADRPALKCLDAEISLGEFSLISWLPYFQC